MANIEYIVDAKESSNATLDFITNRPILNMSLWTMKAASALLCAGFAYALYTNAARPQDYVAVVFALVWLFYYKAINRYVVKLSLKKTKFEGSLQKFQIDETGINGITWKNFKYINKNKDGYIIPIPGFTNAGKFIWLPLRAFKDQAAEQEFLDLAKRFKLPIKNLSK